MARDQTRNIETFKVGGNRVNKFEFHKHQAEMAEQFAQRQGEEGPEAKPLTQAERVAQLMAAAHQKVEKKRKKEAARGGAAKTVKAQKSGPARSADRSADERSITAAGGRKVVAKKATGGKRSEKKRATHK